jgi:hypothetical protein
LSSTLSYPCSIKAVVRVETETLPERLAARLLYRGHDAGSAADYDAAQEWLSDHGYRCSGQPWESYLDGPEVAQTRTILQIPCAPRSGDGGPLNELHQSLYEPRCRRAIHDIVVEGDRQIEDVARFDALLDDGWLAGYATGRLLEERAIRYNEARGRNERWVNRNDSDQVFGGSRVPAVGEARWEYDSGPSIHSLALTDLERNQPARY